MTVGRQNKGEFIMRIKKNLTTIMLLVLALVFLIQGCNTMHGAGKDIEEGGEAIQRAAD
jgi:entericidin B